MFVRACVFGPSLPHTWLAVSHRAAAGNPAPPPHFKTATIGTSFVSAFVDHRETGGDVLWLSALNEDRCKKQCGTGVLAISSTDLKNYQTFMAIPTIHTCNTEVARVYIPPPPGGLPPHKYVMILEPFTFMVNNNADGNLSYGWIPATGSKAPHAPGGGPSIRYEGGHYYVITGGTTVMLCRSKVPYHPCSHCMVSCCLCILCGRRQHLSVSLHTQS
jgi:hypothetical protein